MHFYTQIHLLSAHESLLYSCGFQPWYQKSRLHMSYTCPMAHLLGWLFFYTSSVTSLNEIRVQILKVQVRFVFEYHGCFCVCLFFDRKIQTQFTKNHLPARLVRNLGQVIAFCHPWGPRVRDSSPPSVFVAWQRVELFLNKIKIHK